MDPTFFGPEELLVNSQGHRTWKYPLINPEGERPSIPIGAAHHKDICALFMGYEYDDKRDKTYAVYSTKWGSVLERMEQEKKLAKLREPLLGNVEYIALAVLIFAAIFAIATRI